MGKFLEWIARKLFQIVFLNQFFKSKLSQIPYRIISYQYFCFLQQFATRQHTITSKFNFLEFPIVESGSKDIQTVITWLYNYDSFIELR